MLVLSRQRDESILIGDDIVITVVDIQGSKVRLGINAPTEIPVHRQEVYEAIPREKERDGVLVSQSPVVLAVQNVHPEALAFYFKNWQGRMVWAIMDTSGPLFISGAEETEPEAWRNALAKIKS